MRRAIAAISLAAFSFGCNRSDDKARCPAVARRAVELTGEDVPELAALLRAIIEDSCRGGEFEAGQLTCVLTEARTAFDLVDVCEIHQIAGIVGPELACSDGATQHRPALNDDGEWETWCERDGKRNGPGVVFDDAGDWQIASSYRDDILDGPYEEVEGLTGAYRAGQKHGRWIQRKHGERVAEIDYVDGVASGEYRRYEDGELAEEGHHAADLSDGRWTGYWPAHILQFEGQYRAGERIGAWTFLHENKHDAARGTYVDGVRTPGWKFWNDRGEPIDEAEARKLDWLQDLLFAE